MRNDATAQNHPASGGASGLFGCVAALARCKGIALHTAPTRKTRMPHQSDRIRSEYALAAAAKQSFEAAHDGVPQHRQPHAADLNRCGLRRRDRWRGGGCGIAGSFAQCRIYSKYLGLQIKACEAGLIPLVRNMP